MVAHGRMLPNLKEIFQISTTFILVVFGWIIFRAESIGKAVDYISGIMTASLFHLPSYAVGMSKTTACIGLLIFVEWLQRDKKHALEIHQLENKYLRWTVYYAIVMIILEFGAYSQSFIYFQF